MRAETLLIHRSVVLLIILLLSSGSPLSYGMTVDRVLATIDKEAVTLSDYLVFAKTLGIPVDKETVDERVLRKLMEEKVIIHEARKRGMGTSDSEADKMIEEVRKENALSQEDFEKELIKEGTNIERYRNLMKEKMTTLKLVDAEVDSKVVVTDKEIENAYNADKRDYLVSPAQVEVKAIFLRLAEGATVTEITDLKRKALRIAARLKGGDNFEALVNRYSDEPLKSKGGKLGEFKRDTLIPPLDRKAFSMKAGEISDPIWVKDGVYLLKLEDRTDDKFRTLEEVREDIRKRLYSHHRERIFSEWVRVLWEKASITIN
jgi:parvulin-like peptidyl-prolyl isomerase